MSLDEAEHLSSRRRLETPRFQNVRTTSCPEIFLCPKQSFLLPNSRLRTLVQSVGHEAHILLAGGCFTLIHTEIEE